jgi:hypothetical protein
MSREWFCLADAEREWNAPAASVRMAFQESSLNRILQWIPLLLAQPGDCIWTFGTPCDPEWVSPPGIELRDLALERPGPSPDRLLWLWSGSHLASDLFGGADPTEGLRTLAAKTSLVDWGLAPDGSACVDSWETLREWACHHPGPSVVKRSLASSGRGHLILQEGVSAISDHQKRWLDSLFNTGERLVIQPWWSRVMDFSSQWWVEDQVIYRGATLLRNSPQGRYLGSLAGPPGWLEEKLGGFWPIHERSARALLNRVRDQGFRGACGIDAMIVFSAGQLECVPIVELNPRHTMGWVALELARSRQLFVSLQWGSVQGPTLFPRQLRDEAQVWASKVGPVLKTSSCPFAEADI